MIYFLYKMYRTYINYKMDFTIITPEEIVAHKQHWLFVSNYKNIPAKWVKSIQSGRNGFLWSLCNFWEITFLMDWWSEAVWIDKTDSHWAWILILTYVDKPDITKRKIMLICKHGWLLKNVIN